MTVLDCRGLPCPQPVIRCRDWLAAPDGDAVDVLADNAAAVENVAAFFSGRGWGVEVKRDEAEAKLDGPATWRLTATRGAAEASASPEPYACSARSGAARTLVFIPAETLGRGDEGLGAKLMVNFLGALPELGDELWRIVLVNGGVKLATGGPALDKLKALEQAGVSILVCGTCLDHYGLLDKKQAGSTTNMLDIVTSLQLADKVIRP